MWQSGKMKKLRRILAGWLCVILVVSLNTVSYTHLVPQYVSVRHLSAGGYQENGMKSLKPLVIGDLTAKYPIIQGGMGVGISLSSLAGAVAKAGGIGIISTAQIGFRDPDFLKAPMEANLKAIKTEFDKARKIAPKGIIGFNIMVATRCV